MCPHPTNPPLGGAGWKEYILVHNIKEGRGGGGGMVEGYHVI